VRAELDTARYPGWPKGFGRGTRQSEIAAISVPWRMEWEYDQMSGIGSVKPARTASSTGRIKIKDGDESTFLAEKTPEPTEPIADPSSYRDKWKRRW